MKKASRERQARMDSVEEVTSTLGQGGTHFQITRRPESRSVPSSLLGVLCMVPTPAHAGAPTVHGLGTP